MLANGQVLLDSAFGALVGDGLRGLSYFREGDMRQAERQLRETLREAEATLGPYCEGAVNAAAFLAHVLYEIDDLDGLRTLLESRMDLIERVGLPDAVIYSGIARCRLLRREGSFQEALAEVERLEDMAQRRKLDRLLSFALAERMAVHLATRDDEGAEDALALLRFTARRQAAHGSAAALDVGWRASSARAAWLAAVGRDQEALDTLRALMDGGGFAAQRRLHTQIVARIALLQARLRRPDAAMAGMVHAWQQAQQLGLIRSLLDQGEEALHWGEQAAAEGRFDEATRFHLERVRLQADRGRSASELTDLHPSSAAAAASYEALSEREIAIVRALAAALPNKRIGQALGISPETVKWHLKNVYAKFSVYGRDAAVARARECGYLDAGTP
jgi:LuxR family transcriptional regulator, maltose regulon positive regulatory protein